MKNKKINSKIDIIRENKSVKASWFGIPIIVRQGINKKTFIRKIERNGIETRPIISGNFLNQPSVKKYKLNKDKMKNADYVNKNGFFIGLPTYILKKNRLKKIVKAFEKSL